MMILRILIIVLKYAIGVLPIAGLVYVTDLYMDSSLGYWTMTLAAHALLMVVNYFVIDMDEPYEAWAFESFDETLHTFERRVESACVVNYDSAFGVEMEWLVVLELAVLFVVLNGVFLFT